MKKQFFGRLTLILFVLFLFSTGASAVPLGSFSMTEQVFGSGVGQYVGLGLGFTDDDIVFGSPPPSDTAYFPYHSYPPFFSKSVTIFDEGFTFLINSGNYAPWDDMLNEVLKDGDRDFLSWNLSIRDPGPESVSWSFTADYSGNGIDFQGSSIDNIFVTIDDITVSSAGPESYNWDASWTVVVDGTSEPVPEPATMFLFGTGLIGLASLRLKRKKK